MVHGRLKIITVCLVLFSTANFALAATPKQLKIKKLQAQIAQLQKQLNSMKLGAITDQLVGKTSIEQANLKAQILATVGSIPKTKQGNYYTEVQSITPISDGIEILARAWDSNGQIGFGDGTVDLERFIIINPPILVEDPTGDIVRDWEIKSTGEVKHTTYKQDLPKAILEVLEHTISVKKQKYDSSKIVKGKVGNTTYTYYSAAGENSPVDGYMTIDGCSTWANCRGGNGTSFFDTSATAGGYYHGNGSGFDSFARAVILFDTATLAGTTITSATESLYGTTDKGTTIADSVSISQGFSGATNILANSDFEANVTTTLWSDTETAITSLNTGAYNDFPFNATGVSGINKTGVTKTSERVKNDRTNTTPAATAGYTYMFFQMADTAGTTKDPTLVVEATSPTVSVQATKRIMRHR